MSKTIKKEKIYDLEERTAMFAEDIIDFIKKIPKNPRFETILYQLVKAGTSIGANYSEADDAHSKKDFNHKIGICKKESRETKYWLRLVAKALPDQKKKAKILWKEAQELNLIFGSITRKKNK